MMPSGLSLRGIFPPLTTPFTSDQRVDLTALAENIRKYNATALAGYVLAGSTGESVYLTHDEKLQILEAARAAADGSKILIAGTGLESTAQTIELTRRAASLGYQAALVRTPAYFKAQMTDAVLERHYQAVADASPIPVLIYSVPPFTGLAVEPPLVARLAAHPNIIGIKESSGNVARVARMVSLAAPGFQVLVGSAGTLYPSLAVGATGAVLAVACVLPELCTQIHEAFCRGRHEQARELQHRLLEPAAAVASRYGIAGLKFAMELRGYRGGDPRPPLLPLDDSARAEFARLFGSSA